MATLTIRNLEDPLKSRLRLRAAARNRSMEEEARQILRLALNESEPASGNLAERIRRRFAKLGDVQLPIAPRETVRNPDISENISTNRGARSSGTTATKTARRR